MATIVPDSSVIVAAIKPNEKHYRVSNDFFEQARTRGDDLWVPMTMFWEIGSALDHPDKTPKDTKFNSFFQLDLQFIIVDDGLFQRTWQSSLRVPVKGGDRLFLSCALDKKALLVSWDTKLVNYASVAGVKAMTPVGYLNAYR